MHDIVVYFPSRTRKGSCAVVGMLLDGSPHCNRWPCRSAREDVDMRGSEMLREYRDGTLEGKTALGAAASGGHPKVVELLLAAGARVDRHDAVRELGQHCPCADLLARAEEDERAGCAANTCVEVKETDAQPPPLMAHGAEAATSRKALLLAMWALGVNPERCEEAERRRAEAERELQIVLMALKWLFTFPDFRRKDKDKARMLVMAGATGCARVLRRLLAQGINVDESLIELRELPQEPPFEFKTDTKTIRERDLHGMSAIQAAAHFDERQCLDILLENVVQEDARVMRSS